MSEDEFLEDGALQIDVAPPHELLYEINEAWMYEDTVPVFAPSIVPSLPVLVIRSSRQTTEIDPPCSLISCREGRVSKFLLWNRLTWKTIFQLYAITNFCMEEW